MRDNRSALLHVKTRRAVSAAADARRAVTALRRHDAAGDFTRPSQRGAAALSAADARAARAARRYDDAVRDRDGRAVAVVAAADARAARAARRRHAAAVDIRPDAVLPAAAADARRAAAARRDDRAGMDDDRRHVGHLAAPHADAGPLARGLKRTVAGEIEFRHLEHFHAAPRAGRDAVQDVRA